MRSGTAVLSVLLAALAMPACGGDDDGDVSREDYADQVNRLCRDVERQLNELGIAEPQTRDEITQLIDDVIARSQAAVDRLQALERPGGDAGETADRFVDTLERELERQLLPALEDLKDAIQSANREAAADAAERLDVLQNTESDRFARELGADSCAA
jgi:hypothetical protein